MSNCTCADTTTKKPGGASTEFSVDMCEQRYDEDGPARRQLKTWPKYQLDAYREELRVTGQTQFLPLLDW